MITPPKNYIEVNAAFRCLIKANNKRIFFIEDLSRNHLYLDRFEWNDYLFVQFGWHSHQWRYQQEMDYISQHKNIDINKIIIMGATEFEVAEAKKVGFDSIYVNHNCWLDESLFSLSPIPLVDRLYDIVLVTRPERWKRPYLASLVDNVAIIKGHNFRKDDYFDLSSMNPKFINSERIPPIEVHNVIINSCCGGIFSEEEGACYSSGEYLLSGLPVISTESRGGRDVWYDNSNSIIVAPSEIDVQNAVKIAKNKLISGEFDPAAIRANHVTKSIEFRKIFENKLRAILGSEHSIFMPENGLGNLFKHKMIDYIKPPDLELVFSK